MISDLPDLLGPFERNYTYIREYSDGVKKNTNLDGVDAGNFDKRAKGNVNYLLRRSLLRERLEEDRWEQHSKHCLRSWQLLLLRKRL